MLDVDEDDGSHATIRLLDLPGLKEVEALLVRAQLTGGKNWQWCQHHDEAEELAQKVSMRLFGISKADTQYVDDGRMSQEDNDREGGWWDSHFSDFTHGDLPSPWAKWENLDWDVTGSDGQPLHALKFFHRQIIAAECGLCGHLPDNGDGGLSEVEEQLIEDRLKAEAAKFKRSG